MKKSLLTLVSLALVLVCFTQCTPKENEIVLHQWMKNICGKTQLCKISIPATHDSGALLGGAALQCQDITIATSVEIEQCDQGCHQHKSCLEQQKQANNPYFHLKKF